MNANPTSAGTTTSTGATLKSMRSAARGVMSSLTMSLATSASGWSQPCGKPTSYGPIRFCIRAAILRSSHVM